MNNKIKGRSLNFQLDLPKSREFNNNTKIVELPKVKSTLNPIFKKVFYKAYPRFDSFDLPKPERSAKVDFYKLLEKRVSTRHFSRGKISIKELSDLMYYSFGEKKTGKGRFHPSAGARYPLEAYPVILNVEEINKGIYHYYIKDHSLELLLASRSFHEKLFKQFNQDWIKNASVVLLITAIFDRTEMKYSDRGYRHIFTEYGHISQNIYLLSTLLGLACCSVGGFVDDGLNEILDINGIDESVIGVIVIGSLS